MFGQSPPPDAWETWFGPAYRSLDQLGLWLGARPNTLHPTLEPLYDIAYFLGSLNGFWILGIYAAFLTLQAVVVILLGTLIGAAGRSPLRQAVIAFGTYALLYTAATIWGRSVADAFLPWGIFDDNLGRFYLTYAIVFASFYFVPYLIVALSITRTLSARLREFLSDRPPKPVVLLKKRPRKPPRATWMN
jgi:hypothetical protein